LYDTTVRQGGKLFLVGPRRYGKTSILKAAEDRWRRCALATRSHWVLAIENWSLKSRRGSVFSPYDNGQWPIDNTQWDNFSSRAPTLDLLAEDTERQVGLQSMRVAKAVGKGPSTVRRALGTLVSRDILREEESLGSVRMR
jgi:hypothetical protein